MICAACKGKMLKKNTDIDLRINSELYIVHNVQLEECSNCGEKVIDPKTSEAIYERIHMKQYKRETIEVPTLDLAVNM
jgi:YgiT-type zinc finger domain-containing protein